MQRFPAQTVTDTFRLPDSLSGFPVHLVGIKGTGMAALAEILSARGARITGSDTAEKFYTDALLQRLSIPYREHFAAENLPADAQLVVHSAAYRKDENPELIAATTRGIPSLSYPEALGLLSGVSDSSGISGVHGKSTTTALCGAILKEWGFPATVLVGAEVPSFGGRSTLVQGERFLVAETCEYRRHFLNFHARRIVITSIEPDHLDYFHDLEDMLSAFTSYGTSLQPGGALIYCHDDPGARTAAARIRAQRTDLVMIPYGRSADGRFNVSSEQPGNGRTSFTLEGWRTTFTLKIPGAHNVLNAAAALALCSLLWAAERDERMRGVPRRDESAAMDVTAAARAIESFTGSRRRSEIIGEAGGVLFMDDYAHHPTAIEKTLAGIRTFYPERRLVVDFMSHTYSRTRALLPGFGRCFHGADTVILHRIYASAREQDDGGITARDLYQEVSRSHPRVQYFEEPIDAAPFLVSELRPGDLFLTMGAGDNWKLGRELLATIRGAR
jgi:UDP-N-acetylmuramate--alanine ligase